MKRLIPLNEKARGLAAPDTATVMTTAASVPTANVFFNMV